MKIVEFYRGERPNQNGDYHQEILGKSDGFLECDHDWVQWVFPNEIPSMLNCDAPVLTEEESKIFQADPELQQKMLQSFARFLQFLGMEQLVENESLIIRPLPKADWWSKNFNHTMLRITRVLKALRLTGLYAEAQAFHDGLMLMKDRFSVNTLRYWEEAMYGALIFERLK